MTPNGSGTIRTSGLTTITTNDDLVVIDSNNDLRRKVGNSFVQNTSDTFTGTAAVRQIVSLTQAEYDAIASKDANTLYVIV